MKNLPRVLHVDLETMTRLIRSGRAYRRNDGVAIFDDRDHEFGGFALQLSPTVTPGALYRWVWSGYERGRVFEVVGYA